MHTRTKIVATIGPASESPDVLDRMLHAGVDLVRLNLSHSRIEDHVRRLADVRAAAERTGRVVAVLADLPGPKVRSGPFPDAGGELRPGALLRLVAGGHDDPSTAERITVDYPTLCTDLAAGDRVVLGDGAVTLTVVSVDTTGHGPSGVEAAAHCQVQTGGTMRGRPGVHLPAERLRLTTPTEEDLEYARVMADAGADYLAVSFVRAAADLRTVRQALAPTPVRLVAKVETMPAVANLDEILAEADAVMVARGDLGIECPLEEVPHLQKHIIRSCVEAGVPVITATQVLESMITAPSPTRAEVGDIANAVFDGTDALMLSAETAVGADPVLVVETMGRVAGRAEREASYEQWAERLGRWQRKQWSDGADRITMAITHAAGMAALDAGVSAILCCTRSGRTVKAMARFRPTPIVIGLSPDPATVRAMALSFGVISLQVDTYQTTDEMVWYAVERAQRAGHICRGDTVLVLAGAPDRPSGASTDVLRLVRLD